MRFWHWILRRGQEDRELEEELRFHLAEEARLRMDRGESAESARKQARLDFGNITLAKEVTRQMWGLTAIERAAQDLRFAVRMLIKNAGFTALAVTALALGIGATSAVFTVVRSVLLRPLPFPDPDRLVMIWERQPSGRQNVVQPQNFLDWRQRNHSFENVAAMFPIAMNLETGGEAVQVPGLRVTVGFFEILGTPPLLGRAIRPEDDVPDAPAVVILSYGLWERRFGGRSDAVGQRILLGSRPAEVIGVMPPQFVFPTLPRVTLFALLALTLACVGIYAVISYSVEQRMREMGIRLALGAAPSGILGMVLREGMLLAAIGMACGVVAALGMIRYLATLLYTVRPTDPAVYAAVSAVLGIAAAAGCYFPARRATLVDPAVVLREE